jgi:hypothetical protein
MTVRVVSIAGRTISTTPPPGNRWLGPQQRSSCQIRRYVNLARKPLSHNRLSFVVVVVTTPLGRSGVGGCRNKPGAGQYVRQISSRPRDLRPGCEQTLRPRRSRQAERRCGGPGSASDATGARSRLHAMPSVVGALIAQPTEPSREAASRWFHGSDARATTPAAGDRSGRCPPFCHTFRLAFDCPVSIQLYVGLHPYGDRVINAQREKCAPAEAAADLVDARHDRRARHRTHFRPVGTEHRDGHANISRRSANRSPRRNSRYFGFSPRRCRGATLPSGYTFRSTP